MSILKDSQAFKIILVKLFNDILDYEENVLSTSEFKDLTNNDIHVISAIGMNTKKNMSIGSHYRNLDDFNKRTGQKRLCYKGEVGKG